VESTSKSEKSRYITFLRWLFATRFCYPVTMMKIKGLYEKRGWWYYQPPTVDGVRPAAIALKTKDQGEAVDKAYTLHSKKALHAQSSDCMEELLAVYLKAQTAAAIHTARTTSIAEITLGKLAKDWGNPKVSTITRKKIEEWRAELQGRDGYGGEKMSEASIGSYLRRLSGFLSWLVKEKHLREHPMAEIRLGRVKKTRREKFCTFEQRELLLKDPPTLEIEQILYMGFFAGLRFGEMLAMPPGWLTPKAKGLILTVQETSYWKPKDKECRSIEVHPRLAACFARHDLTGPFVLAPKKKIWRDAPKYRYNPKKAFKAYVASLGMPWVTYHTLRHSFATHLAMKGAEMIEIAHALGDSLRVVEETYIGLSPLSRGKIRSI
jgi:integrase